MAGRIILAPLLPCLPASGAQAARGAAGPPRALASLEQVAG
ncbi:MAG TPA: hypothetical protein QF730_01260 [Planctomycetota bacterium]|nr:hypothetical protein [Planctomycetota bacterium]